MTVHDFSDDSVGLTEIDELEGRAGDGSEPEAQDAP